MADTDGVPWLDDEEQAAWRGWIAVSHRVTAAINRDLARDHGISDAEYAVLVQLSEAPDHTVRMGALAESLTWSRSRLSHLLGRMEARGLVVRRGCPSDARGAFAVLTPSGMEEIAGAAPSHVRSVRRHFLDLLDREQLRQLASITDALGGPAVDGALTGTCPDEMPA